MTFHHSIDIIAHTSLPTPDEKQLEGPTVNAPLLLITLVLVQLTTNDTVYTDDELPCETIMPAPLSDA